MPQQHVYVSLLSSAIGSVRLASGAVVLGGKNVDPAAEGPHQVKPRRSRRCPCTTSIASSVLLVPSLMSVILNAFRGANGAPWKATPWKVDCAVFVFP